MKNVKIISLLTVMALAIVFTSCQKEDKVEMGYETDLVGRWQDDADATHYMVFTMETSDSIHAGYKYYGYEWTESEDVHEGDLVTHGNGWFEWSFTRIDSKEGSLGYLELTDLYAQGIGDDIVPKGPYSVTLLTNTQLSYKDELNKKTHSFTKIANR